MSRSYQAFVAQQPVVVHNHDVLSGRGVNIAHHAGNQRFRTLVTTRADDNYCTQYSASEKRAVAEEIIMHIKQLNPPGRFLRREGRGHTHRGLNGPWEELTEREAIKKTCQALRDCNRQDREGYASGVAMPEDVRKEANQRAQLGLSVKEQAEAAAAASAESEAEAIVSLSASLKRAREETTWPEQGRVSPSVENAAEWLKKQRTDDAMATAAAAAAVSGFPTGGYQDAPTAVEAVSAVYSYTPNDLLAPAPATEEVDEVAVAVAESDDANVNSYRYPQYQYAQYPSLTASEEAMARELAAVGGLNMSLSAVGALTSNTAGGLNLNTAGLNTTGGLNMSGATSLNMNAAGGLNMNAAPLNAAGGLNMNAAGGLNMHNMNEL